jgi:hypothetical protein
MKGQENRAPFRNSVVRHVLPEAGKGGKIGAYGKGVKRDV